MWQVGKNLYLGDTFDAHDVEMLENVGITHILNCAEEVPCWHRGRFRYLHLKMTDPDPDFHLHIERLSKFIHHGRRRGQTLVHCRAGVSRSPSAILAYLCWRGQTLEQGLNRLQKAVSEAGHFVAPEPLFLEQIRLFFERA